MKLTNQQIENLYNFIRQHYVEWYDLQLELVDHLANAIEEQWKENPEVSFEEALQIEFQKFGIFGFMTVIEKKQTALSKKYNLLVWNHFKDFFSIPQIFLVIAFTVIIFSVYIMTAYKAEFFGANTVLLLFYSIYRMIVIAKINKKKNQTGEKRWLFEEIIDGIGNLSGFIVLPLQIGVQLFNYSERIFENDFIVFILSFLMVVYSLFLFIIFHIIPSKAKIYLNATYPEYSIN